MQFVDKPLSKKQIQDIQKTYGDYIKVTADVERGIAVVGCELHADGEELLLQKGSSQSLIWGGGIHLVNKVIDATAVLNLRPSLGNASMEILDPTIRERFFTTVKTLFFALWES